ncbi:hypothetical protein HUJ04_004991 [Dendroctonus ponderosae]|nr:hypothetical protein HUJ04_004991 [Dendroctonus ponderosae]
MELVNLKFNCRICLKSRKPFKDVYCHVVEEFPDPLVQMVFGLFNVQLPTHEAYPQFMCKRCLNRLTHVLLFKQEVVRNQETLFDLFKTSHSSYVEQKFDIRECIPSEYPSAGSSQNNRDDFKLKLEDLSDRIVIKNEALTPPNLPTAEKVENSQIHLNNFLLSELIGQRQLLTEYRSTQIENENLLRSSYNAESKNARASKIKCKEIIRKIVSKIRRTNNCHIKNYVKNETDFGDPSNNNDYLQAAFLQNFNLITLQQAQMLQKSKEQSNKTRLKGAPVQNGKNIKSNCRRKNRVEKSYINLRSKQIKTRNSFKRLPINTSDHLTSKSRHLKKISNDPQSEKRFNQPNVSKKIIENRSILAVLDPNDLLRKNICKTDAISKEIIGCEMESDLKYLDMSKQRSVNTEIRLKHKRDSCSKKKRELVTEKNKKLAKLSIAQRLGSANEIAKPADFHSDLPSKESRIVTREVSTVLRKLRSSGSVEDISEFSTKEKPNAKNLRNSSTNKRKYNAFATSLSSCGACSLTPVSKNSNRKSKSDKGLAKGINKELLNKKYKLESRNFLVSNRSTGALLENSSIESNQINTIPQKKTDAISEIHISKTRSRKSTLLFMGLINKTFRSDDLDLNRAPRKICGAKGVKPIPKVAGGLRRSSPKNSISGKICRNSKNQILAQCYTEGAKCERKLETSILQNVEDGHNLGIETKCVNKMEKGLPIEYVSAKCSNELNHYPSNCMTRIVNIGDNNELQLSLISADSSSSYPTGLLSQTVSYLGATGQIKHGNCYLTIDSKNNIIKLEPDESSDLAS